MKRALLIATLVVASAGTATGIALATRGSGLSAVEARAQVARLERVWRSELRTGALSEPHSRFASPSIHSLTRELHDVSTLCGCFDVIHVSFLHPLQAAPVVVLEAKDENAFFFHESAALWNLLDESPHDGLHWEYEGFFLEAVNRAGIPFLAQGEFAGDGHGGNGNGWAAPRFRGFGAHG